MSIAVGEAPLQTLGSQRVEVEQVLVVDTAAIGVDNLLCQGKFLGSFDYFHAELIFYAGEDKRVALQTPAAGADVFVYPSYRAAVWQCHGIYLPSRVECRAVSAEVHRAGLVHVEVAALHVVVEGMLVGVVPFHLHRFLCRAAGAHHEEQQCRQAP